MAHLRPQPGPPAQRGGSAPHALPYSPPLPHARRPHSPVWETAAAAAQRLQPPLGLPPRRDDFSRAGGTVSAASIPSLPFPPRHGGCARAEGERRAPLAVTCVAMVTPRQRLAPWGGGGGEAEGMTTNMAERSRTAETGQCQPQAPGRGEREKDPISRG